LCIVVASVTEMLLCCACVTLGLAVATSQTMRTNPLAGPLDRPTVTLLSVALGRFIFTFVYQICQPATEITAWTRFRASYAVVNVVCLSMVVLTAHSLVLAVIILVLELGIGVAEAGRAIALFEARESSTRLERAVTNTAMMLLLLQMLLPLTMMLLAVFKLADPSSSIHPLQVGLLCFGVVFYTLCGLIPMNQLHHRRLQLPWKRQRSDIPQSPTFPAKMTSSMSKVVIYTVLQKRSPFCFFHNLLKL